MLVSQLLNWQGIDLLARVTEDAICLVCKWNFGHIVGTFNKLRQKVSILDYIKKV